MHPLMLATFILARLQISRSSFVPNVNRLVLVFEAKPTNNGCRISSRK